MLFRRLLIATRYAPSAHVSIDAPRCASARRASAVFAAAATPDAAMFDLCRFAAFCLMPFYDALMP
jgi:hypothetical protein